MIDLSYEIREWTLRHSFNLSVHQRTSTPAILLQIKQGDIVAYGEISLPPYLKADVESVCESLDKLNLEGLEIFDRDYFDEALDEISLQLEGQSAALAGVDIALHHLYCLAHETTIEEMYGLNCNVSNPSSFTITYDRINIIREKLDLAKPFKILKVKLGTPYDEAFIEAIKTYSSKDLFVDANQGWVSLSEARTRVAFLEQHSVQLIEQPFPINEWELNKELKAISSIPIIADESCQTIEDIDKCLEYFDGINVKLTKAGGIRNAFEMIQYAKSKGALVMLGCMTSSTCAISAANALTSIVDFIDLDGAYLITNDPFIPLKVQNGVIQTRFKLIQNDT